MKPHAYFLCPAGLQPAAGASVPGAASSAVAIPPVVIGQPVEQHHLPPPVTQCSQVCSACLLSVLVIGSIKILTVLKN